ncbi:HAD hydrolase-like protein [Bombilactobacillus bombi]|uniref:HAD hydrolase-like protein n=1 Tax=Bombilactobacillus bombi TaxID=1303590 RepID=UPI0015E59F42|nr:HAD hydrolase-like protein [Bombilactobacillus bombi]
MQNILFDLDGTLIDSGEGIMNALRYSYQKEHLSVPLDTVLRKFIGPPLAESFEKYNAIDPKSELATRLIADFQEFYEQTGWQQLTLYLQVQELLIQLQNLGKKAYITTAKPEPFAKKIIHHLQLDNYFQGIYGADLSETMHKSDVIGACLKTEHLTDPKTCVMVGDRDTDVIGAAANDVATIGVLYGFGTQEELQQAGVIATIEQPLDLLTQIG